MKHGLADERVDVRHSAVILAPSTPAGWLYDPETPKRTTFLLHWFQLEEFR